MSFPLTRDSSIEPVRCRVKITKIFFYFSQAFYEVVSRICWRVPCHVLFQHGQLYFIDITMSDQPTAFHLPETGVFTSGETVGTGSPKKVPPPCPGAEVQLLISGTARRPPWLGSSPYLSRSRATSTAPCSTATWSALVKMRGTRVSLSMEDEEHSSLGYTGSSL